MNETDIIVGRDPTASVIPIALNDKIHLRETFRLIEQQEHIDMRAALKRDIPTDRNLYQDGSFGSIVKRLGVALNERLKGTEDDRTASMRIEYALLSQVRQQIGQEIYHNLIQDTQNGSLTDITSLAALADKAALKIPVTDPRIDEALENIYSRLQGKARNGKVVVGTVFSDENIPRKFEYVDKARAALETRFMQAVKIESMPQKLPHSSPSPTSTRSAKDIEKIKRINAQTTEALIAEPPEELRKEIQSATTYADVARELYENNPDKLAIIAVHEEESIARAWDNLANIHPDTVQTLITHPLYGRAASSALTRLSMRKESNAGQASQTQITADQQKSRTNPQTVKQIEQETVPNNQELMQREQDVMETLISQRENFTHTWILGGAASGLQTFGPYSETDRTLSESVERGRRIESSIARAIAKRFDINIILRNKDISVENPSLIPHFLNTLSDRFGNSETVIMLPQENGRVAIFYHFKTPHHEITRNGDDRAINFMYGGFETDMDTAEKFAQCEYEDPAFIRKALGEVTQTYEPKYFKEQWNNIESKRPPYKEIQERDGVTKIVFFDFLKYPNLPVSNTASHLREDVVTACSATFTVGKTGMDLGDIAAIVPNLSTK